MNKQIISTLALLVPICRDWHIFKLFIATLAYCLIGTLLNSCSDADKFYDKLDQQPEIIADYDVLYIVGDTITIQGRLNPHNGLEIRIGDAQAEFLSLQKRQVEPNRGYPFELDVVEIRITEEMGIGEDRPVIITSAGISINAPAIEIVGGIDDAIIPRQMQLVKVTDIPAGAVPVYCRSGNGNVYAYNAAGKKLFKITAADGSITEVFNEGKCMDANGAFTIDEFNAGAVSNDEKYFYFSAKIKEEEQDRTIELYKLCRFNLESREFETLNRTEYSLVRTRRTLEAVQPFEGNIYDGDISKRPKIYKITGIIPDAGGNIYCNLMDRFLTKLEGDGTYSYVFNHMTVLSTGPNEGGFIPAIYNPILDYYYSTVQLHQMLPGTKISYRMSYMDTGADIMYTRVEQAVLGTSTLRLTDMITRIGIGEYTSHRVNTSNQDIPYVTTSLNRFNGGLVVSSLNRFDPLPLDGKLYGLFFLDLIGTETGFYARYELPAICRIDFETGQAYRYTEKRLIFNNFTINQTTDALLNYKTDDDGAVFLYMTANNRSTIVKTAYVE